ncbi:sulfotransferase [Lysobacter korlensis]|uniref:Sulfotransferase n=1 Tax=Lysobacter korlensis TaxID=553636 RepID=A0ABV6S0K6_9GAMM
MSERSETLFRDAAMLQSRGRRADAIELFQQALALQPSLSERWYELGYMLKAEARYEEALDAYGQALACGVSRAEEVHLNRGVIYSDHLRRDADAEHELRAALSLAPDYLPAQLNLGNLHEERGEKDAALACYDRALVSPVPANRPEENELRLEALARIAKLRPPANLNDPIIARLHEATAVPCSKMVRANLFFALGQVYDRLGAYELAFDAFAKANRWLVRESGRQYDRAHSTRLTDALIHSFGAPSADDGAVPTAAGAGAEPLFICGMYRSGSTLIEQVLAAHPQVTAGGELDYLRRLAAVRLAPFPSSVTAPDAERDAALGAEYRAHLAKLFPDAVTGRFITDKRPDNFILVGLIKRMFPAAKVIHTVRNPLDNGLSVFMQHLNLQVAGYAGDLGDIGHYYGEYRRLMSHWKALYGDSVYEFDYDAFVRDPRPELERLFAFLELPWDDRCLDFHRLGNTVKTASYWQVRQPLHANASGRWRHYSAHLEPLRQALLQGGVAVNAD